MIELLQEERFDFISNEHKAFMHAWDEEMARLGYDFGGRVGSGYCWGKYMLIYRKTGAKSEKVYARMYLRDDGIVLRMFLNDIDRHRTFIENAPAHIKEVFTGSHAACQHCPDKTEPCRFRKTYTIDAQLFEKCNGITFEFHKPRIEKLRDYLALFTEFFPNRRAG